MSNGNVYIPPFLRDGNATHVNAFVAKEYNLEPKGSDRGEQKSYNGGRGTRAFGKKEFGNNYQGSRNTEGTRDIEGIFLKHQSFFTNNSMVEQPSELILFSEQNTAPANYDAYKDVTVRTENGEEKEFEDFS